MKSFIWEIETIPAVEGVRESINNLVIRDRNTGENILSLPIYEKEDLRWQMTIFGDAIIRLLKRAEAAEASTYTDPKVIALQQAVKAYPEHCSEHIIKSAKQFEQYLNNKT